jgi:fructoselysine-6-P-deglycase FrlB-like protein
MNDLEQFVERGKASPWYNGPRLATEIPTFMDAQEAALTKLGRELAASTEHLYLVANGQGLAGLASARYVLDRYLPIPTDVMASYDLIWRQPRDLNEKSVAVFTSLSGENEDAVQAVRYARSRGARVICVLYTSDCRMGRDADIVIPYGSYACFEASFIAALVLGKGLAGDAGAPLASQLMEGIRALPPAIDAVFAREEARAEAEATEFLPAAHIYSLGAGPLYPVAWKLATQIIMENTRIGATYSDAVEFRHGPVEALERLRPYFVFFVGTDESRAMTLQTLEFCRSRAARVLVYDAAEIGDVHPLLTPLVMNAAPQPIILQSTLLRGVLDLTPRVYMGRGLLGSPDSPWP